MVQKEREREYLARAVASLDNKFIVISPQYRLITVSHPEIGNPGEVPGGAAALGGSHERPVSPADRERMEGVPKEALRASDPSPDSPTAPAAREGSVTAPFASKDSRCKASAPEESAMDKSNPARSAPGNSEPESSISGSSDPKAPTLGNFDPKTTGLGKFDPESTPHENSNPESTALEDSNPKSLDLENSASEGSGREARGAEDGSTPSALPEAGQPSQSSPRCHKALFGLSAPCAGCPADTVLRTGSAAVASGPVPARETFSCLSARPLYTGDRLDAIVISNNLPDVASEDLVGAPRIPATSGDWLSRRTVIDALPGGVLVTDREGRITLVNAALRKMLSVEREISGGASVETCIPDRALCHLIREISGTPPEEDPRPHTFEFPPEPGTLLRACIYPCRDPRVEGFGALTTVGPVAAPTSRVAPEYVATLSHEIRSPLTTIHEQLDLVLKYMAGRSASDKEEVLARARDKARGLIALLNDLLDLSRIESGEGWMDPEPVRLDRMLEGIVRFMRPTAESRGQRLTVHLPEEPLPAMMADPMAMESIFGNLITNAINYTPGAGEIDVTAKVEKGMVTVAVSDNGIGISHGDQRKIFRHFHRGRCEGARGVKGTGLGLSIVKGLVTAHGGAVSVQSSPGRGSTFTVRLPLDGAA